MPSPYIKQEVRDAIDTINRYVAEQNKKSRAVKATRWSDKYALTDAPNERVRYYATNLKALRNALNGHNIFNSDYSKIDGVKI